jgi:hypothetical protein
MQNEVQIEGNICPQSSSEGRQGVLAVLASGQHGVVARRQLLQLGFSHDHIKRLRATSRLHDIHRGVYAVGHRVLTASGHRMAAVLACGPGALLSHRSAAALRGLRRSWLTYVEVTVPSKRGRIAGVRAYINGRIQPQDRDTVDGIPCTSVALTLLNLAAVAPRRAVEWACDQAEVTEVFDLAAIDELLRRSSRARGGPRLRAVLAEHAIGTTLTRPGLEELTLTACDDFAIPRPEVNVKLPCGNGQAPEVDFLWRARRLVLETDGGRFHSTRSQIERDRRKEAILVCAGYRVLRATWLQVERDPRGVAAMVAAALAVDT